jgi:hypothetical protein
MVVVVVAVSVTSVVELGRRDRQRGQFKSARECQAPASRLPHNG